MLVCVCLCECTNTHMSDSRHNEKKKKKVKKSMNKLCSGIVQTTQPPAEGPQKRAEMKRRKDATVVLVFFSVLVLLSSASQGTYMLKRCAKACDTIHLTFFAPARTLSLAPRALLLACVLLLTWLISLTAMHAPEISPSQWLTAPEPCICNKDNDKTGQHPGEQATPHILQSHTIIVSKQQTKYSTCPQTLS